MACRSKASVRTVQILAAVMVCAGKRQLLSCLWMGSDRARKGSLSWREGVSVHPLSGAITPSLGSCTYDTPYPSSCLLPKPAGSVSSRCLNLAVLCVGTNCFPNCDSEIPKSPRSKPDHVNAKVTSHN